MGRSILRRIKRLFWIMVIITAVFIAGFNTITMVSQNVFKEQTATFLGVGFSRVLSGSMEPAISVNDMIIFKKQKEYHAGDIVVFSQDKVVSVHRIVKKDFKEIVTKGDYNNEADEPIGQKDIIGKVILVIPMLGIIFKKEFALILALLILYKMNQ